MASTFRGRKFFIAVTEFNGQIPIQKDVDITDDEYETLFWQQVRSVGAIGETGTRDNILLYDYLDGDVVTKVKGISDAGNVQVEMARRGQDKGQIAMRAAGLTKYNYAFKIQDEDGTAYYERGLVIGPTKPNGRQENFNLEVYKLALNQREITIDETRFIAILCENDLDFIVTESGDPLGMEHWQ